MSDSELEQNLRNLLRPPAPSADLKLRIAQQLRPGSEQQSIPAAGRLTVPSRPSFLQRFLHDFGWACAGAVAALVVLAFWHGLHIPAPAASSASVATTSPAPASVPPAAFEHDETTNELVSTEDSDQIVETDDGPARAVRYSYVERHAWSNPQTGARVVLEVPREDVYLLPVSLQ